MDERDNYGYAWSKQGERVYGLKSGPKVRDALIWGSVTEAVTRGKVLGK